MKRHFLTTILFSLLYSIFPLQANAGGVKLVFGEDTWHFHNAPTILGNTYRLIEEDEQKLQEELSNIEYYDISEFRENGWQGACYGLAAVSILAAYNWIDPSELDANAACLHDVTSNDAAVSLINYYFLTQRTTLIRQHEARELYHMTSTERLQKLIACTCEEKPVLLGYCGYFNNTENKAGHAVAAYGVEYGTYQYNNKIYDGRVLIYDNMTASFYDTACLYFDSENWEWYIPMYDLDSEKGAEITLMIDDPALLQQTTEVSSPYYAVLEHDFLTDGYALRKIAYADGSWKATEQEETGQASGKDTRCILPDAESGYVLETSSPTKYDFSMYYENCLLVANASSASRAVFHPTGYAEISGDNTEYTLKMVFNEGHYFGSWYDFTVSSTANKSSLQKMENGYLLKSDSLQNITATVGNAETEETLTFSMDAESVLLYEVNETTLGVKIDTDGDGTFETTIARSDVLGNVNVDESVNASDAADILVAAASVGSGAGSGLTRLQEFAADVNADGSFNASDAALVLCYAAEVGAGSKLTLKEFVTLTQK